MDNCPQCGQKIKIENRWPGKRPYGMMADPKDSRKTIKNFEETATVDLICHRYRQGDSMNAVARWLDGCKILNRSGSKWDAKQYTSADCLKSKCGHFPCNMNVHRLSARASSPQ